LPCVFGLNLQRRSGPLTSNFSICCRSEHTQLVGSFSRLDRWAGPSLFTVVVIDLGRLRKGPLSLRLVPVFGRNSGVGGRIDPGDQLHTEAIERPRRGGLFGTRHQLFHLHVLSEPLRRAVEVVREGSVVQQDLPAVLAVWGDERKRFGKLLHQWHTRGRPGAPTLHMARSSLSFRLHVFCFAKRVFRACPCRGKADYKLTCLGAPARGTFA